MSLAYDIACALSNGKPERNGDGYSCKCPVHNDNKPSMSIKDDGNNDVIVNCFTGCDFKEIKDTLRKMGILPEWKPEGKKEQKAEKKAEPEVPKEETAKQEEKESFIWKGAGKDGLEHIQKYFAGRGIVLDPMPVCFRWNSYIDKSGDAQNMIVAAASMPSDEKVVAVQRLFIDLEEYTKDGAKMHGPCEGRAVWFDRKREKVELLVGEGIETVLSAMQATGLNGAAALSTSGMKNLIIPEETEALYILVDSDPVREKEAASMPGQKAAFALACRFHASRIGRVAYLVSPDGSCFSATPAKLDFNDLLKADPSGETIRARMAAAMRLDDMKWRPPGSEKKEGQKPWLAEALKNGSVARFLDSLPPPLDFVFQDSFLAGTTGLLVGPGAAGKSQLALLLLFAVATGRNILPGIFSPTRAGKVLGVFCEDDERVLHHRVRAIADHLFLFDKEARELLRQNLTIITAAGKDVRFVDQSTKNLAESYFFAEVLQAVGQVGDLRFIALDPISRIYGSEENDNTAATFFVGLAEQLAQKTGAGVLLLHHVSKRAGVDNSGFNLEAAMSQDAARGASGLTNGVRWQCNLFGLPELAVKKELGVKQSTPGQYLAVKVSKKNYGPPEPIHFLERKSGGMLIPVEPARREEDTDLDLLVKRLVVEAVLMAEEKRPTKRLLIDSHHPAWKKDHPKITRPAVEQAIARCLLSGELFEHLGKNASGKKISYLSCYPKNQSERELDVHVEPEIFEPENRRKPEKNDSPVCNPLKTNDIVVPENINRKSEALRLVSPRYCETVDPEICSPYGEDKTSSGLDREDLPPFSVEAVKEVTHVQYL